MYVGKNFELEEIPEKNMHYIQVFSNSFSNSALYTENRVKMKRHPSAVQIWFLDENLTISAEWLTDAALDKTIDGCFAAMSCALLHFAGIRKRKYMIYFLDANANMKQWTVFSADGRSGHVRNCGIILRAPANGHACVWSISNTSCHISTYCFLNTKLDMAEITGFRVFRLGENADRNTNSDRKRKVNNASVEIDRKAIQKKQHIRRISASVYGRLLLGRSDRRI